MKPTLVILAAGMASRYGSMKQIQSFGPSGETIMEYSIYDAIKAGFGKVVFIIREDFADAFKNIFEPKLKGKIATDYVYQKLESFTGGRTIPSERTKPWGTAHAVLCCKGKVNEPFAVINADDFYGRDSFASLAEFFKTAPANHHAMVGYTLKNVLSEHGSVSRGVAEERDDEGCLQKLSELTKIELEGSKIISREASGDRTLSPELPVSMNCWGFQAGIFGLSEKMFGEFVKNNIQNPSAEFYIALMVSELIRQKLGKVNIIGGGNTWFGVTYKEDKDEVSGKIRALVDAGVYPKALWK